MLADVVLPREAPLAFYLSRRAVLLVGALGEVTRVMGSVLDEPQRPPEAPVTLDEINALAAAARAPIHIRRAEWMARFRLHHRATRRYRVGRAFLAGDACHIHTPLGGQGMNTGFQDATNLAWKLAFVLRGAPVELLDTYELERQRVGEVLVHTTDRAFGLLTSRARGMGLVRELVAPLAIRTIMGSGRMRRRVVRFFSQLDIRYHDNALVHTVADGADAAFQAGVGAGWRVPDIEVEGVALHDLLRGPRVHVLALGPCDEEGLRGIESRHGARIAVHRVVATPGTREMFDRFGVTASAICIVRPDGYIGLRSYGPAVRAAEAYLDVLFSGAPDTLARRDGTRMPADRARRL